MKCKYSSTDFVFACAWTFLRAFYLRNHGMITKMQVNAIAFIYTYFTLALSFMVC